MYYCPSSNSMKELCDELVSNGDIKNGNVYQAMLKVIEKIFLPVILMKTVLNQ